MNGAFSWCGCFCGAGVALGGTIKGAEASAAGTAMGFPTMFLSGAFWPIEMMPGFRQAVAKAMPLDYFRGGLRQTMICQTPRSRCLS